MLGPPRYAIAVGHILFAKPCRARLVLDNRIVDDDFLLVRGLQHGLFRIGDAPLLRESGRRQSDVVIVRRASRWQMLRLFTRVFDGSHVGMPCVEYHQVRSLSILSDERRPLDLDGEIKGTTPVSIQTISGAVQMFF